MVVEWKCGNVVARAKDDFETIRIAVPLLSEL